MPSNFEKRTFKDDEEPVVDDEFLNKLQDEVIRLGNEEHACTGSSGGGTYKVARKILPSGTTMANNYEIELPITYTVGNNSLSVYWNGVKLILVTNSDGHYTEVGTAGSISNKIKIYRTQEDGNYNLTEDVITEVVVLTSSQDSSDNNNQETGDIVSDNKDVYSAEEFKTNKIWINNKPIYRKVVDIGNLPNNAENTINHNITNLEEVISIRGTAKKSSGTVLPLPNLALNQTNNIAIYANQTFIAVQSVSDRSNFSGFVIIEYTKTIDSGGDD